MEAAADTDRPVIYLLRPLFRVGDEFGFIVSAAGLGGEDQKGELPMWVTGARSRRIVAQACL